MALSKREAAIPTSDRRSFDPSVASSPKLAAFSAQSARSVRGTKEARSKPSSIFSL